MRVVGRKALFRDTPLWALSLPHRQTLSAFAPAAVQTAGYVGCALSLHTMAEHYTKGRQGQGARRRGKNNKHHRHQRMPRPEAAPVNKPSFVERVLSFFGFKKKTANQPEKCKKDKPVRAGNKAPQKVRIAKTNMRGGNPAAKGGRRRTTSTLPTAKARLYVGNLSYEATEAELEDLFKGFGNVRSVEIIYNTRTYKSKGYAFVEMCRLDDARHAAEVLHGQPFMGRELMVSAASDKAAGENAAPTEEKAPETVAPVAEEKTEETAEA